MRGHQEVIQRPTKDRRKRGQPECSWHQGVKGVMSEFFYSELIGTADGGYFVVAGEC